MFQVRITNVLIMQPHDAVRYVLTRARSLKTSFWQGLLQSNGRSMNNAIIFNYKGCYFIPLFDSLISFEKKTLFIIILGSLYVKDVAAVSSLQIPICIGTFKSELYGC